MGIGDGDRKCSDTKNQVLSLYIYYNLSTTHRKIIRSGSIASLTLSKIGKTVENFSLELSLFSRLGVVMGREGFILDAENSLSRAGSYDHPGKR